MNAEEPLHRAHNRQLDPAEIEPTPTDAALSEVTDDVRHGIWWDADRPSITMPPPPSIEQKMAMRDVASIQSELDQHPERLITYAKTLAPIIGELQLNHEQELQWLDAIREHCEPTLLSSLQQTRNFSAQDAVRKQAVGGIAIGCMGELSALTVLSSLFAAEGNLKEALRLIAASPSEDHVVLFRTIGRLGPRIFQREEVTELEAETVKRLFQFIMEREDYTPLLDYSFLKPMIRTFPEAVSVFNESRPNDDAIQKWTNLFCQKDIFSFEEDEDSAIAYNRYCRNKAVEWLENLDPEKQQNLIPELVKHCIDIDFGDLDLARKLAQKVKDADQRRSLLASIPEDIEDLRRTPQKIRQALATPAENNAHQLYTETITAHGKPATDEKRTAIEKARFYSLNAPLEAILAILKSGHVRSSWESEGRYSGLSMSGGKLFRDKIERILGVRGKGSNKDPHPVYAAMGVHDGTEENTGAANYEGYGPCHIKIDPNFVEETAVFYYGDSFGKGGIFEDIEEDAVLSGVLDQSGAITGKARLELDKDEKAKQHYIEAILTQGCNREHFSEIVIPQSELDRTGITRETIQEAAGDIAVRFI